MTLAKSSFGIAEGCLGLVTSGEDRDRLFATIAAVHERTVDSVLAIMEAREVLDRQPVVQCTIRLRNPEVDPMSAIQVDFSAGSGNRDRRRTSASRSAASAALGRRDLGRAPQHGLSYAVTGSSRPVSTW